MGVAKLDTDEDMKQNEEKRKDEVRKRRQAGPDMCGRRPGRADTGATGAMFPSREADPTSRKLGV
jgi:hypothetical protein